MNLLEILSDLLSRFLHVVPSILGAILIVIAGWIIAKIAARLLGRLLRSLRIDHLTDRLNEIEIVNKASLKILPSVFLSKLLYYFILLIFFIAATDILNMPAVSQLMSDLINYIPYLLSALVVLIIGILLADFIRNIVLTTCQSLGIPSAKLIGAFAFWFIFLTALVSALSQAGIQTAFITSNLSIIIGGGVLAFALGYGFASRDMMANFLASFYIKEKFKLGDVISVDGVKGTIVSIDNASLALKTEHNSKVVVPLSKMNSEKVEIHAS